MALKQSPKIKNNIVKLSMREYIDNKQTNSGGAILLATTYDRTATTGLLFCSQYNVND